MMAQPIFMEYGHTKKLFTTHEQLQKRKIQSQNTEEVVGKDR